MELILRSIQPPDTIQGKGQGEAKVKGSFLALKYNNIIVLLDKKITSKYVFIIQFCYSSGKISQGYSSYK